MDNKDTTMTNSNTARSATASAGRQAEDQAARFLAQRGLKILARNVHCRGGELDIVCQEGKTIVFVEVRLRRNVSFGGAAASITQTKQRRVVLAAQHFLVTQGKTNADCRFDCVLLDGETIDWVRDAFAAD